MRGTPLDIDLHLVPFSRRGSWFTVARLEGVAGLVDGLYLRTVHGDARNRELFRIDLLDDDQNPQPVTENVSPEKLTLSGERGTVELSIPENDRLLIRGTGVTLRLTGVMGSPYDLAADQGDGSWNYIGYGANLNLALVPAVGSIDVTMDWDGVRAEQLTVETKGEDGTWLLAVEEVSSGRTAVDRDLDFDACVARVAADYASWSEVSPRAGGELAAARETAVYLNWSAMVDPGGLVTRPSMLMSKNHMTRVWSWDHCFNALALTGAPQLAGDQLLTMFDHQDELGALPDSFNDAEITFNFVKPPVHGWALGRILERTDLAVDVLEELEDRLTRWTEWWLKYRDNDGDGLPHYNHGNDSGWDNSTSFARFVPVESPDLCSFLVIQMEVLADLAERSGDQDRAAGWRERAESLLKLTLDTFWTGERFVVRNAVTHEQVASDSLFSFLPLILGHRLPSDVFDKLAEGLQTGGFLTEHGLATEAPTSDFYTSDGYWRGPIWAPSTMLIVDGLADGGREDLAADIARRFCATAARSGMAENFDALTGDGLRDRAYTWTSSVFLLLAERYGA
jgi:putative isomerase